MDPYTAMIIAQLGSSALSAMLAPEGQELQSFEGEGALDPRQALTDASGNLTDMLGLLRQRAGQPVNLRSAYVQQPGVITGGGMPIPIGLTGMDPALSDPSLLSLPGLQLPASFGQPRQRTHPGGGVDSNDSYKPHPGTIIDPDRTALPVPPGTTVPGAGTPDSGGGTTPRRRTATASPVSAGSADNVSEYDDLPQATGAVELLLRSLMPAMA